MGVVIIVLTLRVVMSLRWVEVCYVFRAGSGVLCGCAGQARLAQQERARRTGLPTQCSSEGNPHPTENSKEFPCQSSNLVLETRTRF